MEHLLLSGVGLCFTGFCVLLAMAGKLNDKIESLKVDMEKRVTYDWIEAKIDKEFTGLNKSISTMNEALVGTIEKRGIITMFHHHEDRLKSLEISQTNCLHCKKGLGPDE